MWAVLFSLCRGAKTAERRCKCDTFEFRKPPFSAVGSRTSSDRLGAGKKRGVGTKPKHRGRGRVLGGHTEILGLTKEELNGPIMRHSSADGLIVHQDHNVVGPHVVFRGPAVLGVGDLRDVFLKKHDTAAHHNGG
jgi:hypothetical protein